jgi:hypothetical protein
MPNPNNEVHLARHYAMIAESGDLTEELKQMGVNSTVQPKESELSTPAISREANFWNSAGGTNPKKKFGILKPLMSYVPKPALLILAKVMSLGADKYGPYNWHKDHVDATTYIDAIHRHLMLWEAGQDDDPVDGINNQKGSGVSHLGHIMACAAILIDAQENGVLVDNRHKNTGTVKVMERLSTTAT